MPTWPDALRVERELLRRFSPEGNLQSTDETKRLLEGMLLRPMLRTLFHDPTDPVQTPPEVTYIPLA